MRGKYLYDEKTLMWYILSGRYADMAWDMLDDMCRGSRFNHNKADIYLRFLMKNLGTYEVLSIVRTWLVHSKIIPSKLKTYTEFHNQYSEVIRSGKSYEIYPRP
jgi:hypothetical protein